FDAVVQPLPDLGARDLCGGGILHQVVDAHRAQATQPGTQVLQCDIDVHPQPGFGDLARGGGHVEQVGRGDVDVFALVIDLVRLVPAGFGDHFLAGGDHTRMRDPGAVVAVAGLAGLVRPDLLESGGVDLFVLAGDEGGHTADRMCAALVAGTHQQLGVSPHEGHGHGDRVA